MNKQLANIVTALRIAFSVCLVFCSAFSPSFYAFYIIAGVTDIIDGIIARKLNIASDFGAKFDTIADLIFVVVCLIKIIPSIEIPNWIYIWIGIIALIKIINVISGFVVQKRFVSVHSIMNKITGVLLFALPLTLSIIDLKYSAIVVCSVATFSAIQEGNFIRTGKE